MESTVYGFNDALMELLAREAHRVHESVEVFVGRAVSARLVQQLAARRDPFLDGLFEQLSTARLIPGDMPESAHSLILHNPSRLRALAETGLLDAASTEQYDRTVRVAAEALNAPIAAVVLISSDQEVFLSSAGLPEWILQERTMSLEHSISQYVVITGEPLAIEDIRADAKFHDHPIAAGGAVVAYLGVPLTNGDGHTVGTLCVADRAPRRWSSGHVQILQDLADVVGGRMFGGQRPS
jgi:hypothetical protein